MPVWLVTPQASSLGFLTQGSYSLLPIDLHTPGFNLGFLTHVRSWLHVLVKSRDV